MTFRAIPMGKPETCKCQVNDDLICVGFIFSSFVKFGRAELPNFACRVTRDRISDEPHLVAKDGKGREEGRSWLGYRRS
jgi:hypothetical protein